MIKSFASHETELIWDGFFSKKYPPHIQALALRKLRMLNSSRSMNDLMVPPSNKLEKLHGDRKNQHSIRINGQWRICFVWSNGDCYHVEIMDYHH
ncbi:MAG: type II toxin-antitoxin system RelE/ParE family toxin [Spirochaetes bacterium]|nr:type II toxin-antitoxin system RelE/ParE family toxin [Spirochaetota bacterium]